MSLCADLVKYQEFMEGSHGSKDRLLSPDLDYFILFEYFPCFCPIKLISKLMINIKTYRVNKLFYQMVVFLQRILKDFKLLCSILQ